MRSQLGIKISLPNNEKKGNNGWIRKELVKKLRTFVKSKPDTLPVLCAFLPGKSSGFWNGSRSSCTVRWNIFSDEFQRWLIIIEKNWTSEDCRIFIWFFLYLLSELFGWNEQSDSYFSAISLCVTRNGIALIVRSFRKAFLLGYKFFSSRRNENLLYN